MAKMKKKSSPPKNASKKSVAKPIAKLNAAKKSGAKPAGKASTIDAKHKKSHPLGKKGKAAEKSPKKTLAPLKEKAKSTVLLKKAVTPAAKVEKKPLEKETKKMAPESLEAKSFIKPAVKPTAKKEGKVVAPKKGAKGKKEETEEEDDFVTDDDFVGTDEIGEYEEELKAVEELDEEVIEDEGWATEIKDRGDEEVFLTDAEGRRYCRARDCDQVGVVDGYCRFHYLLFWRKIQVRKKILADGKLGRYVEELTARYPDKFLEMIRRDLRTEKDFLGAIQELEIDESAGENELEEDASAYIEEVRGIGEGSSAGVDDEEF
ncbi:MAG TPA: hypothetical protein VIG33_17500 [Pseudobdellovibrionaceae bacterium]